MPETTTRDRWSDVEELLLHIAHHDLDYGPSVRPVLVGARGEDLLLTIWLRPFPSGQYQDPMVEAMALTGGLGCDRLALAISGKAWSEADPIIPILDDGTDLRQRIVAVTTVDGHGATEPEDATIDGIIEPFTLTTTGPLFDDVCRMGPQVSWLSGAMAVAATTMAAQLQDSAPTTVLDQFARVGELGHETALTIAGLLVMQGLAEQCLRG